MHNQHLFRNLNGQFLIPFGVHLGHVSLDMTQRRLEDVEVVPPTFCRSALPDANPTLPQLRHDLPRFLLVNFGIDLGRHCR